MGISLNFLGYKRAVQAQRVNFIRKRRRIYEGGSEKKSRTDPQRQLTIPLRSCFGVGYRKKNRRPGETLAHGRFQRGVVRSCL